MPSLLLIFSTFFDDNSGAGSTQDYFEIISPLGLLDMVAGPGGRRLHGRLPQEKSPSLEAASFRQQDTQMDSLPFSLSKVFNTRLELLLGSGYGSDKLGVPT